MDKQRTTQWPHKSRLTYSKLLPKDGPLPQSRAVPAAIAELVLTLVDAQLRALPNDDDGVRAALADGPLARRQPRDLIADDIGTQGHHRGKGPAKNSERNRQKKKKRS